MSKLQKDIKSKTTKELKNEIDLLRDEIAKLKLENIANPQKDTNIIFKKRKKLAVMLTIFSEKKELEKLTKKVNNQ